MNPFSINKSTVHLQIKRHDMNKFVYPAMLFIILMAVIIYLASIGTGMAILVPIIIVAIIALAFLFVRCKGPENETLEEEPQQQTIQDYITAYGQPDDILVTDVTRGNEPDGAVLIYDKGGKQGNGFLVYNGAVIDKDSITDITFHNKFGTAFGLPDEFLVVLSTNDESQQKVYIRAGNDIDMAQETISLIKSHLSL